MQQVYGHLEYLNLINFAVWDQPVQPRDREMMSTERKVLVVNRNPD
jgi:hypothetical protein